MIKYICEKLIHVPIYHKVQFFLKMISIITTFDEIFNHILNMSWLYHFNSTLKVPFIWFHKECLDEIFHANKYNYVEKTNFVEIYFHLKNNKNYIGSLCTKIHFTCYQSARLNQGKKFPQNNTKSFFLNTFFWFKVAITKKNATFQNANLTKMSTLT
jgi:hypothetical protein